MIPATLISITPKSTNENYIPCLNNNPEHIEMIGYLIGKHTQGWKV